MKLSELTMNIFRNFSNINKNILVKPGNVLTTMSDNRCVVGRATVDVEFPVKFGIYDLPRFLASISLFKEVEFDFKDKCLFFGNDRTRVSYKYTKENMLATPKSDKVELPSVECEFLLKADQLSSTIKAANVMRMPYIAIQGDGSLLKMVALDKNDLDGDKYEVNLEQPTKNKFNMLIDINNMKMLAADYQIRISKRGIVEFGSDNLTYWIAAEKDSTFT